MRLRGASYRRYNGMLKDPCIRTSKFWYRHCLVMCSPIGITPLPLVFWLNQPDGNRADCYQLGKDSRVQARNQAQC